MARREIELLQGMAVFGAVSEASLELILEDSTTVERSAGEYFIREGDEARAFYVLERGRVRVERGHLESQIALAKLGSGDCFGEMALIECANRSASIVALEPSLALRVPLDALERVMSADLEQFTLIQMNLAREVSRRLRLADQRLFEAHLDDEEVTALVAQPHWYVI